MRRWTIRIEIHHRDGTVAERSFCEDAYDVGAALHIATLIRVGIGSHDDVTHTLVSGLTRESSAPPKLAEAA